MDDGMMSAALAPEADPDTGRWAALVARDKEADGTFVFAVVTTGVYCRPSCAARRPLRKNVRFFALGREAEAAGFRPCKRCRPNEMSVHQKVALAVEAACRRIEAADDVPTLDALAAEAGMSAYHFHRQFKAHTGLTPKAYGDAARARRAHTALAAGGRVTMSAFESGFGSLSRFYDTAVERFGMVPSAVKAGGAGEVIVTAQRRSALGVVTAAFSRRGVASVRLSDSAAEGAAAVAAQFREALLIEGGADFDALLAEIVAAVEEPAKAAEMPLDIRGTAFEERVWAALRKIPVGTTATYGEIAATIGRPTAHRAVAKACGANTLAILVPCHRVIRADGSLAGYRWGVERKRALLATEARIAERVTEGEHG
ncbi:bifunctional DNA-binding transcriptional regulator/O6-methylguanine-DNA methyltransferase Ada [Acuticoccus sp. M5D2P5]|uniref:bifunctional DNA-binding transcriptional regulator/O6-methylguanine-DNA methyltransferase Ada n=1 Tax=Acuticoccus kalidii TaxID=2910977 RepID=UPI001F36C591|nr:bifunctional DNA-binding transcriptional regulator/O6-methylguanine-DNA methyltransferase Ada [Acuticoccus kalidii]MCF3935922.1 bifunctional DNA-binding transcriptional regulator/O6-methylguanine-DNA methyltransferase Ada [Acuticoccus kalidii]